MNTGVQRKGDAGSPLRTEPDVGLHRRALSHQPPSGATIAAVTWAVLRLGTACAAAVLAHGAGAAGTRRQKDAPRGKRMRSSESSFVSPFVGPGHSRWALVLHGEPADSPPAAHLDRELPHHSLVLQTQTSKKTVLALSSEM